MIAGISRSKKKTADKPYAPKRGGRPKWTREEMSYLRRQYRARRYRGGPPVASVKEIASFLSRTVYAVRLKAADLGLRRPTPMRRKVQR